MIKINKKVILYIVLAVVLVLAAKIAYFELFKTCGDCGEPEVNPASYSESRNSAEIDKIETDKNFNNLKIIYSNNNGPLPPAYHREYIYTISKNAAGEVTAGYEANDYNKLLEKKSLSFSGDQFNELVSGALAVGISSNPNALDGCTGGTSESIKILRGEEVLLQTSAYNCAGKSTNESLNIFSAQFGKMMR